MPDIEIDLPPSLASQFQQRRSTVVAAAEAAIVSGEHDAVQLFAEHHFEDVEEWPGEPPSSPADVLSMLKLQSIWGEEDYVVLEFGIGEHLSQYVIAVSFDSSWKIKDVEMES